MQHSSLEALNKILTDGLCYSIPRTTRLMFDEWLIPYVIDAHPDVFPSEFCTLDGFTYAHSVYDSRAFPVYDSIMLLAFAELANRDALNS